MVESAVTLQIGTELDLSGLRRDLAALKDECIDICAHIDTGKILADLRNLEKEIECIHVALCIDDSQLRQVLSQKYSIDVELNAKGVKLDGGKLEIETEQLEVDLSKLQKAVTDNFADLFAYFQEQDRAQSSRDLISRSLKPLTDILTGTFESIGRDIKKGAAQGIEGTTGFDVGQAIADAIAGQGKTTSTDKKATDTSLKMLSQLVEIASSSKSLIDSIETVASLNKSSGQAVFDIAEHIQNIVSIAEDIKNNTGPASSQGISATPGDVSIDVAENVAESIEQGITGGLVKAEQGVIASVSNNIQSVVVGRIESFLVDVVNNALAAAPGDIKTIDISKRIQSVNEITPDLIAELGKKGLLQTAIGTTRAVSGTYGALKGAESAVLGLDPLGIAKAIKNVLSPFLIAGAATQLPGVGGLVGEAVQLTQAALGPMSQMLGHEMITTLSGAISETVGGLPLIGGQLEAGLTQAIATAITEAVGGTTGAAATAIVGTSMAAGTKAIAGTIDPLSRETAKLTEAMTKKATAKLLKDIERISEEIASFQLPGTTSVFPTLLPQIETVPQLEGSLEQTLNVKGLQQVYRQLNPTAGSGKNRKELMAGISEAFQRDAKSVREAIAKVSKEGLKAGVSSVALGRPNIDTTAFVDELQKISKTSRLFIQKFDAADQDIRMQTKEGLARLIQIVQFQLDAIEKIKKQYNLKGPQSKQLTGYQSELRAQLGSLSTRYKGVGGDVGQLPSLDTALVQKNWQNAATSVRGSIKSIVKEAKEANHPLTQNISNASPGPTSEIPKNWKIAAGKVKNSIKDIVAATEEAAPTIQASLSPAGMPKRKQLTVPTPQPSVTTPFEKYQEEKLREKEVKIEQSPRPAPAPKKPGRVDLLSPELERAFQLMERRSRREAAASQRIAKEREAQWQKINGVLYSAVEEVSTELRKASALLEKEAVSYVTQVQIRNKRVQLPGSTTENLQAKQTAKANLKQRTELERVMRGVTGYTPRAGQSDSERWTRQWLNEQERLFEESLTGIDAFTYQVFKRLTMSANDSADALAEVPDFAQEIGDAFRSVIGILDNVAAGADIEKRQQRELAKIKYSERLTQKQKEVATAALERNTRQRMQQRGEAISNVSTLVGATAFAFAPAETMQLLIAPFAVAFTPLIAAFASAKNVIVNFVGRVSQVLQELTPLAIRFESIASEQSRATEREIAQRKQNLKELKKAGASEAEVAREQKTLSALQEMNLSISPERLMAVPQGLAKEYSLPLMATMQAYSKFVGAATGTSLGGKGVEDLFIGVSQAIASLGMNAQDAELVFMAFQQMMSKGKISAEELRQQLAERMPGAVQLFAESLGVTQMELNQLLERGALQADTTLAKVAETLQSRYSGTAKEASKTIIGSMNRIQNAIQQSQIAIAEVIEPAFSAVITKMAQVLEYFAERAASIFNFIGNLFFDVVMTMSVSWAAVWKLISENTIKMVAPLMAMIYKYMAPFAINIGVDFIDNFYKAITGKDVMAPLEILFKGITNLIWTTFTAIKALGDGIVSVFQNVAGVLENTFGGIFSMFGKLGNMATGLGVPFVELATTFIFVNQTLAFFGVNDKFLKDAIGSLQIFFGEVSTGAGRMKIFQNALNGITLGLNSFQLQLTATAALLFLIFAKSDFQDPLKIELDKTLQSLKNVEKSAKDYKATLADIQDDTKRISKGFNVTFGISEALGGEKILTDDVIRALRGDLGDAANKAAFTFLATLVSGLGVVMLPLKSIGTFIRESLIAGANIAYGLILKAANAFVPIIQSVGQLFYQLVIKAGAMFSSAVASLGTIFGSLKQVFSTIAASFIGSITSRLAGVLAGELAALTTSRVAFGLTWVAIAKTSGVAMATAATPGIIAAGAQSGKAAGTSVSAGVIGGLAIIGTVLTATIVDVFTGGGVRKALTDAGKQFGLIAVAEMQAEQRRKTRAKYVSRVLNVVQEQMFVEVDASKLEDQIASIKHELETADFQWFDPRKEELKRQLKELQGQLSGQQLFGRSFAGVTEETQKVVDQVASIEKQIIATQTRMNELATLSNQAEMLGNVDQMKTYNMEYERLNALLQEDLATRNALVKPYEDNVALLKEARQALQDELKTLQTSPEATEEDIASVTKQIERLDGIINKIESTVTKSFSVMKNEFDGAASAITKNNEVLEKMVYQVDRLKTMQLANIEEAFAAGNITEAQKNVRAARIEVQALQKQLDVTQSTYEANRKELDKIMQRPVAVLNDEQQGKRKELVDAIQKQEMDVYQLRVNLAQSTVQARKTAEESIAGYISDSANRNIEALSGEADAVANLRNEIESTLLFAKSLSEDSGLTISFNTEGLRQYQTFLETLAPQAQALNVDMGTYIQELSSFASEQVEIDRLLSSPDATKRSQGEMRATALRGRQALGIESAQGMIKRAELDKAVLDELVAIKKSEMDVYKADVAIGQAYINRNTELIAARRAQIAAIKSLEAQGIVPRKQALDEIKQINDEIISTEQDLLTRRSELLDVQLLYLEQEKKVRSERALIATSGKTAVGKDPYEMEALRQRDLLTISQDITNRRLTLIKEESAALKDALARGAIRYEEYVKKEKEINTRRIDELSRFNDELIQGRENTFAAFDRIQQNEEVRLRSAILSNRATGFDRVKQDEIIQSQILEIQQRTLDERDSYIKQEKIAIKKAYDDKLITYAEYLKAETDLSNAETENLQKRIDFRLAAEEELNSTIQKLFNVRNQVVEAQISAQERLTRSTNIYTEALSKQNEIVQSAANVQKAAIESSIQSAERQINALENVRGIIDNLRSTFQLPAIVGSQDQMAMTKYRAEIETLLQQVEDGRRIFDRSKLNEMDPQQLLGLKTTLQKAVALGVTSENLGFAGLAGIEEQIQAKSLEIAQKKAELLMQEQETQRKLLALEMERNKIAAQTAIREAETAAMRAKYAAAGAQIQMQLAERSGDPEAFIQAQLAYLQAQQDFAIAMGDIDVAKQNAVINDRLAQLQKEAMVIEQAGAFEAGRMEFESQYGAALSPFGTGRNALKPGTSFDLGIDPQTQALIDISETLEKSIDMTRYDALLEKLDKAAAPLEAQFQERAIQATDRLNVGVDRLNEKIDKLVMSLGRPNVTINGSASFSETLDILRQVNK